MRASLTEGDALVVVDVQNDFCPGGALPVPDGDKVVPVLNEYIQAFEQAGRPVIASRDWHPEDHASFQAQGGPWPPHCIQGTGGAAYHPNLSLPDRTLHVRKGTDPQAEDYSAFLGSPDLANVLTEHGIERVFVGGLATDYCVLHTALDAQKEGFQVLWLEDASRGIDASEGDVDRAVADMLDHGALAIQRSELV